MLRAQLLGPAATHDPYGRPVADLTASISQRQATLKAYAGVMQEMFGRLHHSDWAIYLERVKLYGEEAALVWLKEKQGQ